MSERLLMRGAGIAVLAAMAGVGLTAQAPPAPARARFELAPCTAGRGVQAECGRLSVPENRGLAAGRQIDIHFVVVRASKPGARHALFMFAGGPGQASATMAGQATGWANQVRAEQDVVFVDQRGTGQSNPLNCAPHAAANPAAAFGHVFDPGWIAACRADLERRADLTQYTTDAAAEDLDAIRVQLGYDTVALYGVSYGTRMAQAYLRRHPDRVSAVVLDGVVPFDLAVPLTYARSAQQSLDRVLAACAADEACARAHPRLSDDVASIMKRLQAGPAETSIRTPAGSQASVRMSVGDFGYAVRGILYAGGAAMTALADLLGRAAGGDLGPIAQRYYDREVAMEGGIAFGMHLSVFCAEDLPFADPGAVAGATDRTFLGRYLFDEYRQACALWPRGRLAPDARVPVAARVPVLLVSGALDPVTPPEFAQRVARALPLSRLVVAPAGGHGSALGCSREAVLHVLMRGTLEGMPPVCQ